ncbi:acyl-CoA transferase [Acuticoccus yangtzensis]|uniref:acyl-CoA transferase n=1 Tax=Acuticoccus yangtzensis TaxID=1443441 RepID=UPI0009496CCE|nr:acyl-CoA transferase [Acuticoccus yangtzensis]
MSAREHILQALLGALQTIPSAAVLRGEVLPERVPADGLLILRDGDPGDPEVTLSPRRYHYEHRAEVEAIVAPRQPADRAEALDDLVAAIGIAIAADRTLGGLCDWCEASAPQPVDLPVEGAATLKAAIVPITLTYLTADPLA